MNELKKTCKGCGQRFKGGRIDKKFCDDLCRMAYHKEKRELETPVIFFAIEKQLKINRRVLRRFNPGAKVTVRKKHLYDAGFNEKCFTHVWKNNRGKAFWFVYEYGFTKVEKSTEHFLLVIWQSYMNKQLIQKTSAS